MPFEFFDPTIGSGDKEGSFASAPVRTCNLPDPIRARVNNEESAVELYFLQTSCRIESKPSNKNDEVNDLPPVT